MEHYKPHISFSLWALLLLNVPAWSMDMSDMSNMDMSMPTKKDTNFNTHSSTQVKHHPTKSSKPAAQKVVQTTAAMDMDQMTSVDHETHDVHTDHSAADMQSMPMPDTSQHDMHQHNMNAMPMTMDNQHINLPMNDMLMDHAHQSSSPADARSSDYSQGRDLGPIHPPMMMGNDPLMSLAVKRLEWQHGNENNQGAYDIEGWWGDDWNRAVLKAEGEISNHSLSDARTELLWRRPLTTFWNTELGVRQDSGYTNNRTWAALGINGIAPYWLHLDTTLYARDQSQTELILTGEYDWRITQQLVLQPRVEMSLYSKNDRSNDIGEGLSQIQSSVRLRYEINRQFAPYLGVENNHAYGKTADLLNSSNQKSNQSYAVAGVMFWF